MGSLGKYLGVISLRCTALPTRAELTNTIEWARGTPDQTGSASFGGSCSQLSTEGGQGFTLMPSTNSAPSCVLSSPHTDSDTSQTPEPLTDRGWGACSTQAPRAKWGAKALHTGGPLSLCFSYSGFPMSHFYWNEAVRPSGFSRKAGSSCKAFHRHLFLTTCLSTFSIDQTVKKQEMSLQDGLNWPGHGLVFVSSQWPAAFQSYPLVGNVLTWLYFFTLTFLEVHTNKTKQLKKKD